MKLTEEQRKAVVSNESAAVFSCPGSGKTRTIIAKILSCLEIVRGTTRRVTAITYTNAAVDEIESRLREICSHDERMYFDVSTIHSFCLNRIFRPFHSLLPEFTNGFTLLPSEHSAWQEKVHELSIEYDVAGWAREGFERVQRNAAGFVSPPDGVPVDACIEFCKWCDSNNFVTLPEIIYHSFRLEVQHRFIASGLASRFAWILVDEFQDSSAMQMELLRLVHGYQRTQFFLVGDPHQSLYRFAGADVALMRRFAEEIGARTDFVLSGNFRSSATIVSLAEQLCPNSPAMEAVGDHRNHPSAPVHLIASRTADAIINYFLPKVRKLGVPLGEAAVLAAWWIPLWQLARELRERGVPVIGPGARPYKRSHIFSMLAEPVCAYLESREPEIVLAVQRALFVMLREITGHHESKVFSYYGKCAVSELLKDAEEAQRSSREARRWLTDAADRFQRILVKHEFLPQSRSTALSESASLMCDEIDTHRRNQSVSIDELGLFARPKNCLYLTTIHKSKGREFDAVAVVDLHDGRIPHFNWNRDCTSEESDARWEDARRMLYVGVTRAKRELVLITEEDNQYGPSPFLSELDIRAARLK